VDGASYSVDMHAVDLAGNVGEATQKTDVTFDTTAPILTSFDSNKADTTAQTAYGKDEVIDIRAIYGEPLAAGSTVTVRLENSVNPPVDVVLDQISGNELSGTFVVDGPRKGYDTQDLNILSVVSENVIDSAENVRTNSIIPAGNNLADNKTIMIDTGTAILMSVEARKVPNISGAFKEAEQLRITATYSKPIASGGITVHLNTNNGSEDSTEIPLTTIAGSTIYGTYAVAVGDNAENLAVSRITAQNATDFKGNVLDTVGTMSQYDAYFDSLNQGIAHVQNISNIQIDTTSPVLGATPIAIQNTAGKTSLVQPNITLSATDNYNLSQILFSLNGGASWCAPIAAAANINTFDITSVACGGSSANGIKTVTVKFRDAAGNDSTTASASVEYDNSKPVLETITTDTATGTYGPTTAIKIIATYDEVISAGNLVINLNNGKELTLSAIENGNTLTGTYTVGATDSVQDTNALRVAAIVSQSAADNADPVNIQNGTSLAGITENLDTNKTIEIDTTAPAGTITIDRSKTTNQIHLNATDKNSSAMKVEVAPLSGATGNCSFTNTWSNYADNIDTTLVEAEPASNSRKVCVRFRDSDALGNVSDEIFAITPETPTGLQIDDISNSEISFYGSMLTWSIPVIKGSSASGDPFAQYEVFRCADPAGECTPDTANTSNLINDTDKIDTNKNYFVDTGLTAENFYCYQVRFKDKNGDYSRLSQNTCFQAGHAPVVTDSQVSIVSGNPDDIKISDVTEQGATVFFQTKDSKYNRQVATKAQIEVYTSATLSADTKIASTPEETNFSVMHTINITGLDSGMQYYLKITATDSSAVGNPGRIGILAYSQDGIPALTFTTLGTLKTISDVKESIITDSKAVITFMTDQEAKCFIDFKDSLSAVYNDLSDNLEGDFYRNHSITLTQLLPTTTYDYKITCTDKNDVSVVSEGHNFKTTIKGLTQGELDAQVDGNSPAISNISLASVTGESATITWDTNEKANSSIVYEAEGATFSMMAGDSSVNADKNNFATSHTVVITGLIPATKYLFTALSYDLAGNIGSSSESNFTTKAPSSLSSIKVVSTALGQANVTWSTSSATSSLVEYGLSTAYGQKKEDSSKTKEHEILLSGLTPGETYHFRVRGEDDQKNVFASSDITFQPKAPPKISDFSMDAITEHGATVKFLTSVPTDALITFANVGELEDAGAQGNPMVTAKHEVKLKDLTSGQTFSVKVKVRDEDGNETEETFANFTTTKDENPPKIDRVKTDTALTQTDKVQAIISWTTDELATGKVVYKEGKAGEEKTFNVNDAATFSHIGVITSFKPGVVYYFKVKSSDAVGNQGTSTDFAVLTPKKRQNIIQIIIGNFTEIFGWAKF